MHLAYFHVNNRYEGYFLKLITIDERNHLHLMLDDASEVVGYSRAKIILLKDAGFTVPEIRREERD